jgi:hypothetical protein
MRMFRIYSVILAALIDKILSPKLNVPSHFVVRGKKENVCEQEVFLTWVARAEALVPRP